MSEIKNNKVEPEKESTPEVQTEQVLEDKDKQIKDLYSQLLRLKAEFDNYRKRSEKEKNKSFLFGKQEVLEKTIDFNETIDKAIEMCYTSTDKNGIIKGLELLKKEFDNFLNKQGVKQIDIVGKKFDPEMCEVVGYEESNNEEDIVIKEVQKGYIFTELGYVLRPAKVIISKKSKKY